jgi:ABC-2 type transport system permease protein
MILAIAVLGLFTASLFQDPTQLGPFKPVYFLQPLFVLALPTVVLINSLLFAVAILSRNVKLVYVSGVLLYVLYLLGSILGNSPLLANSALKLTEPDLLTVLADPFGLAPFFQETRSWTIAQRNGQLFGLQGDFLLNRLSWTGVALLLLAISYRYFQNSAPPSLRKAKLQRRRPECLRRSGTESIASQPWGNSYYWAAFRQQLKLEISAVFKHLPFFPDVTDLGFPDDHRVKRPSFQRVL